MRRTSNATTSGRRTTGRRLECIRQFTPNWFGITMGTGVVYLVLAGLPSSGTLSHELARALWIADIGLFAALSVMFAARFIFFSETIGPLMRHPMQSLFLGAIPMGLAPIINGIVTFVGPTYGDGAYRLALFLWLFDSLLALGVAVAVPYLIFTRQEHKAENISAALLLPIVAPEVCAVSAGLIAPHVPTPVAHQVVGVGYILWAVSVPLAFSILTLVLHRLVLHKLPHRDAGVTSWLTVGPIGTGALGLLTLGDAARTTFAGTQLQYVADTAAAFGVFGALLLWAAGAWWLTCAALFMLRYRSEGLPFNLGWWGFTFPLGVYTLATLSLAHVTSVSAFKLLGLIFALTLFVLWSVVLYRTLRGLVTQKMFYAPCLS